jgi:hypothetical protein
VVKLLIMLKNFSSWNNLFTISFRSLTGSFNRAYIQNEVICQLNR